MNKEIFGGFIADLRKAAGMTQKQVADRLHVTDRAVSKWERGLWPSCWASAWRSC